MMSRKPNEEVTILIPATVFFIVNTLVQYLQQMQNFASVPLIGFLVQIIAYNAIAQIFAYLTCRFLVIKRNKGQKEVWANYIIWILVMNLGTVSEMVNK